MEKKCFSYLFKTIFENTDIGLQLSECTLKSCLLWAIFSVMDPFLVKSFRAGVPIVSCVDLSDAISSKLPLDKKR